MNLHEALDIAIGALEVTADKLEKDGAWVYETRDTIADAINAALDEAEGGGVMPETYEQRVTNLINALEELSAWLHQNMNHSIVLMAHEDGTGIYADAIQGREGEANYLIHGSALNDGVGDSLVELATVLSTKEEESDAHG